LDVDKWLSEIQPRLLDEWIAYHRLEPWGDDWEQAAMIAAKIHNTNVTDESRLITPQSLIPNEDNRETLKEQTSGTSLADAWKQRLRSR